MSCASSCVVSSQRAWRPRLPRRSISPACGRRSSTRISPSAFPVRTSATTPGCRSTMRRACAPISWDASLLTLPEHQCKPHPSTYGFRGVGNLRIVDATGSRRRSRSSSSHAHSVAGAAARHLDGRASASAGVRGAHLAGFLHRRWEGDTPRRDDDAPQGGLDSPQRAAHDRSGDDGRSVHPPRRTADAHLHHRGPDLSHRAARQDQRLPADAESGASIRIRAESVVEVPREKGVVPSHLPGKNPFLEEFAKKHNLPQRVCEAGLRRRCRIHERGGEARAANADPPIKKPAPVADNEMIRSTCRATCGCCTGMASTPRCRSVTRACSSLTR